MQRLNFGVDLITFFHPGFWGVSTHDDILTLAEADPTAFWTKLLDAAQAAGVTGIELTFAPLSWEGAIRAFGTREAFQHEVQSRGLQICSGFFAEMEPAGDITDPAVEAHLTARAESYAQFLAACGADIMVVGLPLRASPETRSAQFFDLAQADKIAGFLNRLGAAISQYGVRLALHTEAHSLFAAPRDVDLMLLLTDPAYVHLCPDTAHIILAGGDPVQLVDRHHDRMIIAHWKDALGPMPRDTVIDQHIHDAHRPWFCPLGTGRVDWPAWARLLQRRDFRGWAILELDASANPVADIAQGLTLVRQSLLPTLS
ncbi:sugar phosphate isomerase/epimerase family protein [Ketogulonicigenium vulgare]|uniref:Xylose isomerase domain protein TIM barrel n=1 Tax=Ketogulonicigenium vulgare (strain WSH-001) TaxID=759362 RepID=F9YB82_KETVW|nr:sugar phosphate isomerase/epimerase [Ketogulonicigenium vulgare]ADO44110.1 Xylose isomerase domain protein TIM barrel [Ketogulonicigenium vulgare Y25]AEM42634.1 Xylose isomerase domain protein TIM barrel [Ketogulonicigenium vulgare WSH-001]ALJ82440.1 xylose isomerase [Ketogulonicigenium vulgare]ANW35228.1 xylose isomerase [Ketogulonicigenium vulgare]AOZ53336.1 Xylose isomerase domain protein TIM barrel [Ketogulonicigenium vulgare]